MESYRLTTEVFCLPHLGRYIAYAPLKGYVLLVNAAAANLLADLAQGTLERVDESNLELLSLLMDLGLVNGQPDELHEDGDGEFHPTDTTLFLTRACNLRCVYCYASGGERPGQMAWEVARAAVDLVAENARAQGSAAFGLGFHGGGEPTVAWDLMTRIAQYAEQRAAEQKATCSIALATNGVLRPDQLDWITAHVRDVNVSVDGVGEWHDRQRPLRNGEPSFPHVLRTLQVLSERRRQFGIRMTVTRQNLDHMADAVKFLAEQSTPHTIHLEPVFQCGRCVAEGVAGPTASEFVATFRAARAVAEMHGTRLYYSGARYPQKGTTFCQAAGQSFTVTTEGAVTACFEVSDERDPRSETFFYGRYDGASGRFAFDEARRARLRELTVQRVPFCQRCVCKYHCAGDCPAKRLAAFEGGLPDSVSTRCAISQELTRDQIVRALEQGSQTVRLVAREAALAKEVHAGG